MAEDHWQPARLIPTSGISGQDEAERRATSALLAVIGAVRDFALAIIKPLGAPAGTISTFIEVPFKLGDRTCYPDGLIESSRAGRTWVALVEVKTGSGQLERPQVETYLDIAREAGIQAVLTISNQIAPAPGVHPVDVDKRKLRRVALHHLSWAEVLTIAVQQRVHRGVSDPDQAWILGELIRYLEHPRSGALDFADMGTDWVPIREAVAAGTVRLNDKGVAEVISRWDQLLRFAALRLGRELGADVEVALSRKELSDPTIRLGSQARSLTESGTLTGAIRIPDAVAPLVITADLRAGRVAVSVDIDAPKEGRAATRVNWLIRQLQSAPDGLRLDAYTTGARTSTSELLGVVRQSPTVLIDDSKRDFRLFRLTASSPLGTKRGAGRGSFIDSVLASIDGFYEAVVQQLRPWTARAPQLPRGQRTAAEEAGLELAPPPRDLQEQAASELLTPPEEEQPPNVVEHAVAEADSPADAVAEVTNSLEPVRDGPLVSWDEAQDRLDRERSSDRPSSNATTGNGATRL
jgi:hypothetical protein